MQGVPPLLGQTAWLRLQLVVAWQKRLDTAACGVGSPHYAEVTRCFLEVSQDSDLGGVARSEATAETTDLCTCVWMGAVLTSMMFVTGAIYNAGVRVPAVCALEHSRTQQYIQQC